MRAASDREVINLTEQVTTDEIETALANRPYYPYRYLFSSEPLRQRLVKYVLQRTHGVYIILQRPLSPEREQLLIGSQQAKIRELVHQGIGEIALAHLAQKRYKAFHLRNLHDPIFQN
ncbi:hypothetical protein IQ241_15005 [Romeria aff. gracilis LEGE 07310]|uniref:Uncharacterized protein n=1 Tax=Vasconcelosia minhoensis LEGE 07310 TaxID=915328 RepID=A0A8J7A7S6_9CYAN|nr:hypothetical protein [Romeria gracilis]MBE9078587.1 hypothetical protein [Romeria aff. gracilis LEGE 07310]